MLYGALYPDTLTTIHTWAHLALETHIKTGLTNDSETQSSHVSLRTLWGHSNTKFKSLLDERWNIFNKLKHVQLPTIKHLDVQSLSITYPAITELLLELWLLAWQPPCPQLHQQPLQLHLTMIWSIA